MLVYYGRAAKAAKDGYGLDDGVERSATYSLLNDLICMMTVVLVPQGLVCIKSQCRLLCIVG